MTASYLGENVVVGVGPLVIFSRRCGSEVLGLDRTDKLNVGLGQSKRFLRIAGQLVIAPARGVSPRLIQQRWRESVVPDQRKCVVDHSVVPQILCPDRTVVIRGLGRYPVEREGKPIFTCDVGVHTSVVLVLRNGGR